MMTAVGGQAKQPPLIQSYNQASMYAWLASFFWNDPVYVVEHVVSSGHHYLVMICMESVQVKSLLTPF